MDRPTAAGLTSALVAVLVTAVVTVVVTPPWRFGTILLGVAVATFATGYVVSEVAR